jgi:hypothetical protein
MSSHDQNDQNDVGPKRWPLPAPFDDIRNLYVGPISEARGTIETDEDLEPLDSIMWGEVLFYQEPVRRLRRLALYGVLAYPEQDPRIGVFSLVGPLKTRQKPEALDDSIGLSMRLHYRALNPLRVPSSSDERPLPLPLEQMEGILTLDPVGVPTGPTLVFQVTLKAKLTEGLLNIMKSVSLESHLVPFRLAGSGPSRQRPQNSLLSTCPSPSLACDPGLGTVVRTLPIKFVSFSEIFSEEPLIDDLVVLCNEQIQGVCEVWRDKAALDLVVWPNHVGSTSLVDGLIVVADDDDRAIYSMPDSGGELSMAVAVDSDGIAYNSPTHVEIYLVDELPSGYGGGVTHIGGDGEAYCILDVTQMPANPYLLAHELGHALGLEHPDEPCPGSWESVMKPTGGGGPNPNKNTLFNCRIFLTPATSIPSSFVTGLHDCDPRTSSSCVGLHHPKVSHVGPMGCFRPDRVDHFVGDCPDDAGEEPSWPFPCADLWSDSSVWNRRSPGSGETATGPIHEEPFCTGENRMYVKLEYCTELRDPVCVDLYLADPGVSPGHELLVPLKPLDPDGTPNHRLQFDAAGSSETKSLAWSWSADVPPGYPLNNCVFALAHSMDEPLPFDPATVTFGDVHPLLAADNDIAQRNLHIQSCTPTSGASLWSALPWVQLANPFAQPAEARIEIDTSLAPDLKGLSLEIDSKPAKGIDIGGIHPETLPNKLSSTDRHILRLRATLPDREQIDPTSPTDPPTEFPIDLRFLVGEQLVTGYRHLLRVAPLSETVAQVLDSLFGALRDVKAGCLAQGDRMRANQVQDGIRELVAASAADPEGALQGLSALSDQISELAESLAISVNGDDCLEVREYLSRLGSLLATPENATSPNLLAEQIRDLADHIQEPAGRLARRRHSA